MGERPGFRDAGLQVTLTDEGVASGVIRIVGVGVGFHEKRFIELEASYAGSRRRQARFSMVGVKEPFRWSLIDQCLTDEFNEMFQRIEGRGWIARSSPVHSNDKTRCH